MELDNTRRKKYKSIRGYSIPGTTREFRRNYNILCSAKETAQEKRSRESNSKETMIERSHK
eukprot:11286063-Ditylum_brightwellii.AAC.1